MKLQFKTEFLSITEFEPTQLELNLVQICIESQQIHNRCGSDRIRIYASILY